MSSVVRPSGPLPSRVYWVRRLLLLAIVLVLVWALVRVVGGGGDEPPPQESAAATPAGEETEPVAAEADETETEPGQAETDETEARPTRRQLRQARKRARRAERAELRRLQQVQDVSPAMQAPVGPCDLTQVTALPEVPTTAYVSSPVTLRVRLSTDEPTTCTMEVDHGHLLLSITQDGDTVWTSTACRTAIPRRSVVLRPHWTSVLTVQWSGRRTGGRCSDSADPAAAGEYLLQTAVLTGEPASTALVLSDPVVVEDEKPDDEEAAGDERSDRQDRDRSNRNRDRDRRADLPLPEA